MQFPASQIALLVNGKIEGDPSVMVSSFGKIEDAKQGQLSFLANPKYEEYIYSTAASLVLINDSFQLRQPVKPTLIRVTDAYTAFAIMLGKYQKLIQEQLTGIQQPVYIANTAVYGKNVFIGALSYIGENVKIGDNTKIFPHCYIGDNVVIGADCLIDPGVKIYRDTQIGDHVNILAGTVIGSDGFGFAPQQDGSYMKIPQVGNVTIEDHVDIGANVTIDRATIGSTIIHSGAKIDNLVQVAHNVEIGANTVIAAQAGISGSTRIGKSVLIGGQAGIVGHIQVGDNAKVNAQSGVSKSIDPGKSVTGSPAQDFTTSLRTAAMARNLPDLEKRVRELEILIKQLLEVKVS